MTYTYTISAQKKATAPVTHIRTTAAEQKVTIFAPQKPTFFHVQKKATTLVAHIGTTTTKQRVTVFAPQKPTFFIV